MIPHAAAKQTPKIQVKYHIVFSPIVANIHALSRIGRVMTRPYEEANNHALSRIGRVMTRPYEDKRMTTPHEETNNHALSRIGRVMTRPYEDKRMTTPHEEAHLLIQRFVLFSDLLNRHFARQLPVHPGNVHNHNRQYH
jgi:hypothetical protein